jgi:hypothetical protein
MMQIFKEVRSRLEKEGLAEAADLEVDIGLVYRYLNSVNYIIKNIEFIFLFLFLNFLFVYKSYFL